MRHSSRITLHVVRYCGEFSTFYKTADILFDDHLFFYLRLLTCIDSLRYNETVLNLVSSICPINIDI